MSQKNKIVGAAISGAIAVTLGALGAHALRNAMNNGQITETQLEGFETGVRYHFLHTLLLLLMAILPYSNSMLNRAYSLTVAGICLFSGSLYLLCTRNLVGAEWLKMLGPVTPLGGICLIAGWVLLAWSAMKKNDG